MGTLQMKNAFSMLTAIFMIVLMSSVAIFVFSLSGKIVKTTTNQYQHEQALLYAKSYSEYAVLAVTANDRSTACLNTLSGTVGSSPSTGDGYQISGTIAYIGTNNANIASCTQHTIFSSTSTKTPLTVIIDIFVRYKDPDNPTGNWFTVHRRTIQKI